MSHLLAIDPGNIESAWVRINIETYEPLEFGKEPNMTVRSRVTQSRGEEIYIEMVASYGMAVGKEVFDTCVWIGRFMECCTDVTPNQVFRKDIKLHHCGQTKAKDSNIIQALIDRFAPDTPNRGKGSKANPGFFYGFKADVWQAYALAVYKADVLQDVSGVG